MADGRPSTPPVLATRGLTRHFGGLVAVRDVAVSLHQGELHAVIGPNGAGKTTLVNLLSGEIKPTAGHIELDGRAGGGRAGLALARLGVGRSFQRTNIFAPLTVLENVRLAAQAVDGSHRNPLKQAKLATRPDRHGAKRARARRPRQAWRRASPARCRTASSASSRSP